MDHTVEDDPPQYQATSAHPIGPEVDVNSISSLAARRLITPLHMAIVAFCVALAAMELHDLGNAMLIVFVLVANCIATMILVFGDSLTSSKFKGIITLRDLVIAGVLASSSALATEQIGVAISRATGLLPIPLVQWVAAPIVFFMGIKVATGKRFSRLEAFAMTIIGLMTTKVALLMVAFSLIAFAN